MDGHALISGMRNAFIRLSVAMVWNVQSRREFYDLMADFIHDGVGVHEATEEIHDRYVKVKDARKHITQRILDDQRGAHGKVKGLGASLAAWVPPLEAMVIEAGERATGVEEGLRMASQLAHVQSTIKNTVVSKLSYPGFLIVLLGLFILAIGNFLIPVFEELSPRSAWPTAPAMLGKLTDYAELIVAVVFSVIGAILLFFTVTKDRWVGNVRDVLDQRIPPWSIYRQMTGAILMSIFALLTRAGVPFSQTIAYLDAISGYWLQDHLGRMKDKLRKGDSGGDAIASVLFDEDIRWKIEVYGRRSNFSLALESLSKGVQDRTIEKITAAASFMRGAVYIMITAMFAWVYASFMTLSFSARSTALLG